MTTITPVRFPARQDGPTGPRLLAATAATLPEHEAVLGPIPWRDTAVRLVDELERSGLTGRGGAAFPTWRKVTAVADGQRPVVVGNAAEGEPASGKDAALLTHAPHLVLDGLQLAAEAVHATDVYLYVKAGAGQAAARSALAQRRRAGWDRAEVTVVQATEGFVSGEESAVVSAIEGGPALPRFKRQLVVKAGVKGRPTLVQNVETLAHVALIARYGADWFRSVGVPGQPGTFLATVSGSVTAPGVVEAPYGTPIGEVIALAGGPSSPVQAVLVGGYHGAWLPADPAMSLPMSREALAPHRASPGAGVVVALPVSGCGLQATARIVRYLADSGARQCGPCMFGLPDLAGSLARLAAPAGAAAGRRDKDPAATAERLATLLEGRGACHHPDGTIRLVRSALRTFADDVEAHRSGSCRSGGHAR